MWSNMVQNWSNLSPECSSNVAETCATNGNQRPQTDPERAASVFRPGIGILRKTDKMLSELLAQANCYNDIFSEF